MPCYGYLYAFRTIFLVNGPLSETLVEKTALNSACVLCRTYVRVNTITDDCIVLNYGRVTFCKLT